MGVLQQSCLVGGSLRTVGDCYRFQEGSDGDVLGPPEIISEHVPVPLDQPSGTLRGGGGFGRVVLGSLPDDYPPSASRLTLTEITACIQLCADTEGTGECGSSWPRRLD